MSEYIYQLPDWPNFRWNTEALVEPLSAVRLRQGRIFGRMEALGFPQRNEAMLRAITDDVVKSSEIEGEILNPKQVRSSIARRLGMDIAGLLPEDRAVEGVVQVALEATGNYSEALTRDRLFRWHTALFPDAPPHIKAGVWRDDARGPMQVVSGPIGHECVHYEAPPAAQVEGEMAVFLDRVNRTRDIDPILRAAEAHLWFVTIHPFDDGNGRIARAIADWALARSENSSRRYYSMSARIQQERSDYYDILERTQRGTLDITGWLSWFLGCLDRAIAGSETSLAAVLEKDRFWKDHAGLSLNERQILILNRLLDGSFEGNLTSTKWTKLAGCSQDTASRDIHELIGHGILAKSATGGRSTSYSLRLT